jgi:hypothetical protein
VREELRPVEEQWGVRIRELGFSNLSPTPPTLEITQLRLLAQEKLGLYHRFTRDEGLTEDAAVALISGAVMAVRETERLEPVGRGSAAPAAPPSTTTPADGGESPVPTG